MSDIIRGEILSTEIIISDAELTARVGMPTAASDAAAKRAIEDILCASSIKFIAARTRISETKDGSVSFSDGFSVKSEALCAYFSDSSEAFMFMITLGSGADRLIMKKKALSLSDGFLYDGAASAIVEAACDALEKRLARGLKTKNRFSPGYADCPLSVQNYFMSVLSADKYIGVKLCDSLLMTPMKSVSAFIAIKHSPVG